MYSLMFFVINIVMACLGYGYKSAYFWIVQAIMIVGFFLKPSGDE